MRWLFLLILYHLPLFSSGFVLFTEPKTGTHLLMPILAELSGKEPFRIQKYSQNLEHAYQLNQSQGTFMHMHTSPTSKVMELLRSKKCVNIFVKRDPRDRIISLLNHYKNIKFLDPEVEQIPNDDDRLLFMIRKRLKKDLVMYKKWLNTPQCCVLEFHKLMGSHGGAATDEDAIGQLRKMTESIGWDVSDVELEAVYRKHFGQGNCFYRGKVNVWKTVFNEEHTAAVKEEIGDLLIELGYEKDYAW